MPTASSNWPPDPIVRYRLRTLLMITMALAVLAAIAGPYYRSVEAVGQRNLLVFWSILLAWTGLSFWLRLRDALGQAEGRHVKFLLYSSRRSRFSAWSRLVFVIPASLFLLFYIVFNSIVAGQGLISPSLKPHYSNPLVQGLILGGWAATLIFAFVSRPLLLCEEGIPLSKHQLVRWRYIRNAEWLPNRPGVMKLRRYDGDIYIEVPPAIREEVEAFIREKIGADVMTSANN